MARHIFKPWHGEGCVRSVSLCGRCYSTRRAIAATAGQHGYAGDCLQCQEKQGERARMAGRRGQCTAGKEESDA